MNSKAEARSKAVTLKANGSKSFQREKTEKQETGEEEFHRDKTDRQKRLEAALLKGNRADPSGWTFGAAPGDQQQ